MAWRLRKIMDKADGIRRGLWGIPGTCFYAPASQLADLKLSPKYHANWAGQRAPICIWLPNNNLFCVDELAWNDAKGGFHGDGWDVVGSIDNDFISLTAHPSINYTGRGGYHGWLKDGVLSDDVDRRQFTPEGKPL